MNAAQRAGGRGQQGPELRRRVHAAQRRIAVGLRRHRPAEGREGRADADRRVRHAAGLSRLAIRQRLQLPGPDLRGDRPGGRPVPPRPAGPDGPEGAQRERRDGADRNGRATAETRRSRIACRATTCIPAAEVQGVAAPGVATGTALQRMEELAAQVLPPGIGYEWTEIAYQQEQKGTPTMLVFGAAALFVFLVLAANYESWKLPLVGRADRADVPARLGHRAAVPRHADRHPGADRLRGAGRAGGEERDPDRRVRAPGAGRRQHAGGGGGQRAHGGGCGRS